MKKSTFLFCLMILVSAVKAQLMPEQTFRMEKVTGFVENKGQVMDQYGRPNDRVRFTYSEGLFNLQLKEDGFSYELFETVGDRNQYRESDLQKKDTDEPSGFDVEGTHLRSHRIDVKLQGSSSSVEMRGQDATGASFNFYTSHVPQEGITGVQSYREVVYHNIYPDIDLVFTAPDPNEGSSLKYEWVLHPGAVADRIRLQYRGANMLEASTDGGFMMSTSTGRIEESKVIAYYQEDESPIPASYRFEGNKVSYNLSADKNKTIVIDPNIIWSTYYGGNKAEDNRYGKLTTDSKHQVIIIGYTSSTQYIASNGAFQMTYGGGIYDAFIAKFNPNGKLIWSTYFGSTGNDKGTQVAADPSDNLYLSGYTASLSGIATEGTHQTIHGGEDDVFVAKFNSSGIRQWATYLGGAGDDEIYGAICDVGGNLYFTGFTLSFNQIATPGAYQETKDGDQGDAFIGEFTPGGTLAWCTFFGGNGNDRGHGIALGNSDVLFVHGTATSETQMATPGTHQTVYGGKPNDAFISKWDTNGHLYWCSYFGGEHDEHGREVVTDEAGNAYLAGFTNSKTGISTPGAIQPDWFEAYESSGEGLLDGYIAKFNPDGNLEWSTYYGGSGSDEMWGLAFDPQDETLYAGGRTSSPENIATEGSFIPEYTGTLDGCLVKLTPEGMRIWGSYMGIPAAEEELFNVRHDGAGFLYLYLRTNSTSLITPGTYQTSPHGGYETVVTKFSTSNDCYDRYEPNNSLTTSKQISTFSDTLLYGYTAAIADADDEDWYNIKSQIGANNFRIELTDLTTDYDLKLYRPNGQLVKVSANGGTEDEAIIYNNAPIANYRLEIAHNESFFDPNSCYRIRPMTSTTPWAQKAAAENSLSQMDPVEVHLFPNPCYDQLHIKITSSAIKKISVTLYNLFDQPVFNADFEIMETTEGLSVPVRKLIPGMYLLEVDYEGNKLTQLVAVQN